MLVVLLAALIVSTLGTHAPILAQPGNTSTSQPLQMAIRPPYQPAATAPVASLNAAVQGTLRAFDAVADADIRSQSPTTNFGIAGTFAAGYGNIGPSFTGQIQRALLDFNVSTFLPPGTTIHQAQLQLALAGYCDYQSSRLTTYRVSAPWAEMQVTWASQPAIDEAYGSANAPMAASGVVSFDLTSLAQAWVSGQQPEYGLMIRGPESSPVECSSRLFLSKGGGGFTEPPRLVVDYTLPAPALAAPNGNQIFFRGACGVATTRMVTVASNDAALADWSATIVDAPSWLSLSHSQGRVSRIFPDSLTLELSAAAPCLERLQAQVQISAPGLAAQSFSVTVQPVAVSLIGLPLLANRSIGGAALDAAAPKRVAIIIGVSDYQNFAPPANFALFRAGGTDEDINFARGDTEAFKSSFSNNGGFDALFALPEDFGTYGNILHTLEAVAPEFDAQDTEYVVVFSGHGAQANDNAPVDEQDGIEETLVPYDAKRAGDVLVPVISDDQLSSLLNTLQSQHVAVILDACYSGGVELGRSEHALLAASAENQLSWETSLLEHGVFSYYLLQAMQNPATDTNCDGWISLLELYNAIHTQVASYVQTNMSAQQTVTAHITQDVRIVRTPGTPTCNQ